MWCPPPDLPATVAAMAESRQGLMEPPGWPIGVAPGRPVLDTNGGLSAVA
jgi:hypothetical protein